MARHAVDVPQSWIVAGAWARAVSRQAGVELELLGAWTPISGPERLVFELTVSVGKRRLQSESELQVWLRETAWQDVLLLVEGDPS